MGVSRGLIRVLIVLGFATLALILGYVGLETYLAHQRTFTHGWPDVLYYDLQLFVLSSTPLNGSRPLPGTLQVARFLAAATTVLAFVEAARVLLGEQVRSWSAAAASNHAIVTGDGPAAAVLADRLRAEYRTVVLISPASGIGDRTRRTKILKVSGDPSDVACLRAAGAGRATVIYACADESADNAATALRAREMRAQAGQPLKVYAQVRDAELCAALRAQRIGSTEDRRLRLDFFSFEELAARVLLDRHSFADEHGRPAHVLIVGFGLLGRAVLREIARRRVPGSAPVRVTVIHEAAEQVASYINNFPAIIRDCVVRCAHELPSRTGNYEPCLLFVCLPDNDDALRAGLAASHKSLGRADTVIVCMSQPSPFGAALGSKSAPLGIGDGRIMIFDMLEEACAPQRIRADLTDQLARAIHRAYIKNCAARGESPNTNTAMRVWEELSEDLKHSNLEQGAHIGTKLNAIGCALIPESRVIAASVFTDKEIELLARMEHERWYEERKVQGYKYGHVRAEKEHPDLVDWAHLGEVSKEKDRDAVRELPGILLDAGFQIIRLQP